MEKHTFDSTIGDKRKKVTVSHFHAAEIARREGYDTASPKKRRVREYTAHHKRVRAEVCGSWLKKSQSWQQNGVFADEKGFGIVLAPNPKCDVIWVKKEDRATSNVWICNKSDEQRVINLFVAISRHGVEAFHIYDKNFTDRYYKDHILPNVLGHAIQWREQFSGRGPFSFYYHDHCMRGTKPVQQLDDIVGKRKWLRYAGPPCKTKTGKFHQIEFTNKQGTFVSYKREIQVAMKECVCVFDDPAGIAPALSPDCNPTENFFNFLLQILKRRARNGFKFGPSQKLVARRISEAIAVADSDTAWFRKTFDNLPKRWSKIVRTGGELTTFAKDK